MPAGLRTGLRARGVPGAGARASGRRRGQVKIGGEVWTARAYDDDEVSSPAPAHVMKIDGATALVSE